MRERAARGGAATKARADAEYYRAIGAMGGRASKGKPKTKRAVAARADRAEADRMPVPAPSLSDLVADLDAE